MIPLDHAGLHRRGDRPPTPGFIAAQRDL